MDPHPQVPAARRFGARFPAPRRRAGGAVLLAALLTAAGPLAAAAPAHTDDHALGGARLGRDELVAAVVARNPSLAAAAHAVEAARQAETLAVALPDPEVRWGVAPLTVGGERFIHRVEVGQRLPWPGRRGLLGEAAAAATAMAAEEVTAVRRELALEASLAWADWYHLHAALGVNTEHSLLVADLQESATARYAAGRASQQDPLQAEVELARLERQRLALERQRGTAAARLNALLHRPIDAPLPPPGEAGTEPAALPTGKQLRTAAVAASPAIAALDAELLGLEAERALARLARRPDVGVMGSYDAMPNEEDARWMVGVAVMLPVRRAPLAAREAAAEARLEAARQRRAALADRIAAEVAAAELALAEARAAVVLAESRLVPAARDRMRAAEAALQTARTDFPSLVEATRELRQAELELHEATAEVERRAAELAYLLGRPPMGETPSGPAGLDHPDDPADDDSVHLSPGALP